MPPRDPEKVRAAVLQGTLDLLIMRTLLLRPSHGQAISRSIQQQSDDVFLVDHGSLYLALQRLEAKGYVHGEWGVSENNRRARFYKLTPKGRAQLTKKSAEWKRIAHAIARILTPGEAEV